jgi:hypothetical protein
MAMRAQCTTVWVRKMIKIEVFFRHIDNIPIVVSVASSWRQTSPSWFDATLNCRMDEQSESQYSDEIYPYNYSQGPPGGPDRISFYYACTNSLKRKVH